MIPVEYLWLLLVAFWGLIGSARGLAKELGVSAILLLCLFTLFAAWDRFIGKFVGTVGGKGGAGQGDLVLVLYYGIAILFVAYISYEGFTLAFPVKPGGTFLKPVLGFIGGMVNGYLIIGTIWDVLARADYLQTKYHIVSCCLSNLHNSIVRWLPVTLMDRTTPFIFLVPGIFLLLLIVLK